MMGLLMRIRHRSVGQIVRNIRILWACTALLGLAGGLLRSPPLLACCGVLLAAALAYGLLCCRCPFCRCAMGLLRFSPGRICLSCGTELTADSPP